MFALWNPDQPEITDLIVQHHALSLERLPVRKAEVLAVFSKFRNQLAMRAVRALPERDGILDAVQIDRQLLMVHWEMQRLAEEFSHGRRVWELLRPSLHHFVKAVSTASSASLMWAVESATPCVGLPRTCL